VEETVRRRDLGSLAALVVVVQQRQHLAALLLLVGAGETDVVDGIAHLVSRVSH
jgi:hypothetical protein